LTYIFTETISLGCTHKNVNPKKKKSETRRKKRTKC
jgi:hypothetical protein